MSKPSVLLKQHIGTVEQQIEHFSKNRSYQSLINNGCSIKDGVLLTDPVTGARFTPRGMTWDISKQQDLDAQTIDRVIWVHSVYLTLMHQAPQGLLKNAQELESRRDEYARMVQQERMFVGNKLFWVNSHGIWIIKITAVHSGTITFDIENSEVVGGETCTRAYQSLKLFDSYDDAVSNGGSNNG